jgi:hypothetical protein
MSSKPFGQWAKIQDERDIYMSQRPKDDSPDFDAWWKKGKELDAKLTDWTDAVSSEKVDDIDDFIGWLRDRRDILDRTKLSRVQSQYRSEALAEPIRIACHMADDLGIVDHPASPAADLNKHEALAAWDTLLVAAKKHKLANQIGSGINEQIDKIRASNRRRNDAAQERENQEEESRMKRWANAIRATPTYDGEMLKIAADGMRKLVADFKSREIRSPLDVERLTTDLLCDAIKAGAFSGKDWHLWRTRLADKPYSINAVTFLADYAPPAYRKKIEKTEQWMALDAAKCLADLIESFQKLVENQALPVKPDVELAISPKLKKMRLPSDIAVAAYRVRFVSHRPQQEIASVLTIEFRRPVGQNQVSRWIKQVERWVQSGKVLPELPKLAKPARSIDPSRIDIGTRTDHLAPRHRPSASNPD